MRPRYWLLTTLSTILVAATAVVGLNMTLDVYGLYRPSQGRRLSALGDPRVAKYLLSARYVPENFNALLSGASISANWNVGTMERLRVYNESLTGGNIVEEKSLIEAALQRPGVSVVLLLVHPGMTESHEFHTVDLTPALRRSALGSWHLWSAYRALVNIWLGRRPAVIDHAGVESFEGLPSEMNVHTKEMWSAPEFAVDPIALQAYRDLVGTLRAHGVKIVFIVPPIFEQLLQSKAGPLERYLTRMRSAIGPGDLWIDFLSHEYEDLRKRRANFSDGVHLTSDGATLVVGHIDRAVERWMAEPRPIPE